MASQTLQKQGVPIPAKLTGRPQPRATRQSRGRQAKTPAVRARTLQSQGVPIPAKLGSQSPLGNREGVSARRANQRSRSMREFSPVRAGNNASPDSGVGLLEAEFLIGIVMLGLLMFSNTDSSLADKIMSTMKRGTLVCAVFFFLALIAGIGPHAAKFSKAFGALVIVAIVVSAPVGTVLTDVDNIVKNDWVGTTEHGDDTSADLSTASNSSSESIGSFASSLASTVGKAAADKVLGLKEGSPTANAFWAAVDESNTLSKLLNPVDEVKGTWDTIKAITDGVKSVLSDINPF